MGVRMYWLSSYPLKTYRCGSRDAKRQHYATCALLQRLLEDLEIKFGTIPSLPSEMQTLDYIMNRLPRSEARLSRGSRTKVWIALIGTLREIDGLSHPNEDYDEDEPNPEDAFDTPKSHSDP